MILDRYRKVKYSNQHQSFTSCIIHKDDKENGWQSFTASAFESTSKVAVKK